MSLLISEEHSKLAETTKKHDEQIKLIESAEQRAFERASAWLQVKEFKAALHQYDHEFTDSDRPLKVAASR